MTEPPACLASLPVSKLRVLLPMVSSRVVIKDSSWPSFTDVQSFDQIGVSLGVFEFEVVEQPPALADEHQEAAAGMVILGVRFEVFGQIVDALAQNRDLNFW